MGELSDHTLDEIRERACSEATPRAYERLGKKLYNEHRSAELAGQPEGAELLNELRELANAHCDLPNLLEVYGTTLNNLHVWAGKRGDLELGRFAREELARLSEFPQASSRVVEFFATSLSDGHKRLHAAGDKAGARALLASLKQLSNRYPSNRLVLTRLCGALVHEAAMCPGSDKELDQLRAIEADPQRSLVAEEFLMQALSNKYVRLEDAVEADRAEALLDEARGLVERAAVVAARGYFSKILRNKHYYLAQAAKFESAEIPMRELLAFQERFLGETAIIEQTTAVLQNGHTVARAKARPQLADEYLALLGDFFERNSDQTVVAKAYTKCLYGRVCESLNPGAREHDLDRLRQMAKAYPDQIEAGEYFKKALRLVHEIALIRQNHLRAAELRRELRALTVGPKGQTPGTFGRLLVTEVANALGKGDVEQADHVLWELRSLFSAYPADESTAAALAEGIAKRFCHAAKTLDPEAHELMQELRSLDSRFPTSQEVAVQVLVSLALSQVRGMLLRRMDLFEGALAEARLVCDRVALTPSIALIYGRILSLAIGAEWMSLRFGRAMALNREFKEVVGVCEAEPKIANKLASLRRSVRKNAWAFFQHYTILPQPFLAFLLGLGAGKIIVEMILKPLHLHGVGR